MWLHLPVARKCRNDRATCGRLKIARMRVTYNRRHLHSHVGHTAMIPDMSHLRAAVSVVDEVAQCDEGVVQGLPRRDAVLQV